MFDKRYARHTSSGQTSSRRPPIPRIFRRGRSGTTNQALPRIAMQVVAVVALFVFVAVFILVLSAYSTYQQVAASLKPRIAAIHNHDAFETSRIYDRNGTLLYEFFDAGKRTRVKYAEISPLLIQATIAIEDKTFFENTGVDYEGIARAIYQNLKSGEEASGASTITQQVVRNIILTDEERRYENRYERKFKEIILAQELNKIYTKKQILELYLNEVYYGNLAYGIEAASEVYFNIHARDLNLAQASLLGGLVQLPSSYNPMSFLQRDAIGGYLPGIQLTDGWLSPNYALPADIPPPKWRQIAVLRQMVDEEYITERDAVIAAAHNLRFVAQDAPLNAPHFVFYTRKVLEEKYSQQTISRGGLNIYTTLDLDLQHMVREKAAEHIESLRDRNIYNASVVVMQPNTGQILAMVGSVDYNAVIPTRSQGEEGNVLDGQVNVAIHERQPGSALKPFTYLAAMERGMTPSTILWDVPTEFLLGDGSWYAPENYNGKWNGPVRIRFALANSLNMPAVKALRFTGVDYTLSFLDRVGIKKGLNRDRSNYGLSLTLGGGEVSPLELTTAYNTLASGGRYNPPEPILKITDNDGNIIESYEYQAGQQVVNPGMNSIIVDMLSDDKARKPIWGRNSKLKLSRSAAVKTGTSEDWRDAWTVGFTPYVTVGVWSGNNNNEPTDKVESLEGGGIIWHNVMEEIFDWIDEKPAYRKIFTEPFPGRVLPRDFTLSEGVERRSVCPLPGPFGGYSEELFTQEMVFGDVVAQASETPDSREASSDGICNAYTTITAVEVPGGGYCLPVQDQTYDPEQVHTLRYWNVPPDTPDIRVSYIWSDGSAGRSTPNLPFCTTSILAAPTPEPASPTTTPTPDQPAPIEGAIQMPGLYGMQQEEARAVLSSLGVRDVYIDQQTRQRIPDTFDQYAAGTVISTLPHAGEWILPGSSVILGVRAAEGQQPGLEYPTTEETVPPAESTPTPVPDQQAPIATLPPATPTPPPTPITQDPPDEPPPPPPQPELQQQPQSEPTTPPDQPQSEPTETLPTPFVPD